MRLLQARARRFARPSNMRQSTIAPRRGAVSTGLASQRNAGAVLDSKARQPGMLISAAGPLPWHPADNGSLLQLTEGESMRDNRFFPVPAPVRARPLPR